MLKLRFYFPEVILHNMYCLILRIERTVYQKLLPLKLKKSRFSGRYDHASLKNPQNLHNHTPGTWSSGEHGKYIRTP
jgi:hypothetical protein